MLANLISLGQVTLVTLLLAAQLLTNTPTHMLDLIFNFLMTMIFFTTFLPNSHV